MPNSQGEAWIAAAASALRRNGSWTGRIHLHKHLFLLRELELAEPPFTFVLYQYGPYSYDLDSEIAQMEMYGYLYKSFPRAGYGPQYSASPLDLGEASTLDAESLDAVERVAAQIGNADSQSLELRATCIWVEREEGLTDDDEIIERVAEVKPKYDHVTIRAELAAARALVAALAT